MFIAFFLVYCVFFFRLPFAGSVLYMVIGYLCLIGLFIFLNNLTLQKMENLRDREYVC